jgi:natural product precursor
MTKKTKKPTLQLKKETLRKLEPRALSDEELAAVLGGVTCIPRYTTRCDGCL